MAKSRATHGNGVRSPDKNDVRIGRLIREKRQQAGLSQTALADHSGISFQQIQKYEKGTNRVSVGRLHQIAEALDVPATSFFESKPKAFHAAANESVNFLASAGALRLIKAYNRMNRETRATLAALAEEIAEKG
jgi:transcriptional regulator with XRE-family HTH domain